MPSLYKRNCINIKKIVCVYEKVNMLPEKNVAKFCSLSQGTYTGKV